jgi:putative transposase
MPRCARIELEEGIFHIMCRGNNGQGVFKNEVDFRKYKDIIKELKDEQPFKLYHYCLMDNHVHLVIQTNEKTQLSKLIKRLNLKYYHYYKKKYGYSGHFWQDRFKSLLIERKNYLLACGIYIERNPVRAKITKNADGYKYSSYRYYVSGENDEIMDRDISYDELGKDERSRQGVYRNLMLDREYEIGKKISSRFFLGGEEFIESMERKFKVSNVRLCRGRPRKDEK